MSNVILVLNLELENKNGIMKKIFIMLFVATAGLAMSQSKKEILEENKNLKMEMEEMKTLKVDFNDEHKKFSYAVVKMVIGNLKEQGIDSLDKVASQAALNDYFADTSQLNDNEIQNVIQSYMQKVMEKKSEAATAEGRAFLAENAKKSGITITATGLQYEVLTTGTGDVSPTPESTVTVHYTGTLVDGTVFDSSVQRGEPATFPVNGVIKGWTEALQLMKIGDKFKLYIPSELGYGAQGAGGSIPPHSVLIFEVELLEIK